jgi:hypothetical protein
MNKSGIVLIIVGVLFLAHNVGLLELAWLMQWWPLILVGVGIWSILQRKPCDKASPEDKSQP